MIVLIIILAVSSIGWLYILCRSLNRIAAMSDKLINLILFGGIFLFLTPFLFVFWLLKLSPLSSGLFFLNFREILNQNFFTSILVLIGFIAFSAEIIRRRIVKKLKSIGINKKVQLQSTKYIDCVRFFPTASLWKHIYKIASLIPGNKINKLYLQNYKIEIPGDFKNIKHIRIVHLTDIHYVRKVSHEYYEKIVSAVNECNPDLILFTGDFLQNPETVLDLKPIFSKLKAKFGIYFVCGNHDIWHDEKTTTQMLQEIGFVHLAGKVKAVDINGEKIYLAGTEQPWIKDNITEQLAAIPDNSFVIFLSHTPDNIRKIPLRNIKLVLSGHTHGGQNALPGLGPLIIPSRYGSTHESGFVEFNDSLLYISRGVALHSPLRTMCPLEIACMDVCRAGICIPPFVKGVWGI